MNHLWGYPNDSSEVSDVEILLISANHPEVFVGGWCCIKCRTIYCEHCQNLNNLDTCTPNNNKWKLANSLR